MDKTASIGRPAHHKILEITSYPPPRAGWGVRVQFLKRYLEQQGHECVVLNIGTSRKIPSSEYETVLGAVDYAHKVWRYARQGFVVHMHANGTSPKGFALSIVALGIAAISGRRSVLTFHAGIEQIYFPRRKYPSLLPVFWALFGLPRWIICNSEDVKAKIVEYGVPASKVIPIPAFSVQYLETGDGPLPPEVENFFKRFPEVIFCYIKMRPLFFPELTVESFGRLAAQRSDAGLLLCGIAGNMEPGIWPAVQARLSSPDLKDRVLVVDDMPHELFLQALGRSSLYLRTHLSDGVCSSVMESLSLGVPVVAIENYTRPPGVISFETEDPSAIAALLGEVLSRRSEIAARMERPQMRDTLSEEAQLLVSV